MAAALAEAHPWQDERYDNTFVRSSVRVFPWDADNPVVPADQAERALTYRLPVWVDQAPDRLLLLAVQSDDERLGDDREFVVVASAPAVRLSQTVVPFLLSYGAVASAALLIAGGLLWVVLSRAMGPLERASRSIGEVGGLDAETRLELDGPPEVRGLLEATNQLLERLQAAYQSQISFTALAAHELRTPVTVLKGEVALALRRERSPSDYKQVLHRLQTEFDRLHALVDGLLLLSRVDAGQVEQGKQVERLSHPIHRALAQERTTLDQAGCTLQLDLESDPELSIHVALLTSALATLLRNAAQHAPGTTVRVTTASTETDASICIDDDGPGIVDPDQMMERFSRSKTAGMGLGLPIAAEIARRHGGHLVLTSNGGTRVRLTLPLLMQL
jgi:signal transduction histidine kinase